MITVAFVVVVSLVVVVGSQLLGTGAMPSSFAGSWAGRMTAPPGTEIPPRAVTVDLEVGSIGSVIGQYRYPDLGCAYDLKLLGVRPEGTQIAGIRREAVRTVGVPEACTEMIVEFDDRGDTAMSGDFETVSKRAGPTTVYLQLQRVH